MAHDQVGARRADWYALHAHYTRAFSPLTPLYPPLLPCHSGVYQENRARATRCAGLVGLDEGNCTEANICRLASGNKFLSGGCPVY